MFTFECPECGGNRGTYREIGVRGKKGKYRKKYFAKKIFICIDCYINFNKAVLMKGVRKND